MSRETMRAELRRALAAVGVPTDERAPAEALVRTATAWMMAAGATARARERADADRRSLLRVALARVGHDPGAHASLDDLIAEACAELTGRVVGR